MSSEPSASETETSSIPTEALLALDQIGQLLIGVSLAILVGTAIFFGLDFLPATLLGTGLVGSNFFWTRRVVLRGRGQNLKRQVMLLYVLKLGLSVLVIYWAIVQLKMNVLALLIGLSNIVIAIILYSIIQTLYPRQR